MAAVAASVLSMRSLTCLCAPSSRQLPTLAQAMASTRPHSGPRGLTYDLFSLLENFLRPDLARTRIHLSILFHIPSLHRAAQRRGVTPSRPYSVLPCTRRSLITSPNTPALPYLRATRHPRGSSSTPEVDSVDVKFAQNQHCQSVFLSAKTSSGVR